MSDDFTDEQIAVVFCETGVLPPESVCEEGAAVSLGKACGGPRRARS